MKKLNLILGFLIVSLIFSCSKKDEKEDSPQLSQSELLVKGSPWTFDHYELITVIDSGDAKLTKQQIEDRVTTETFGLNLSFMKDGSGFSIERSDTTNFTWKINSVSKIYIKMELDDEDANPLYDNATVTADTFVLEFESSLYGDDERELIHYGKYFFN